MGREVKRVATDFHWPLDKVWRGYVNPHPYKITCSACEGQGYSKKAKFFFNQWYGRDAHFDPVAYGREHYTTKTPGLRAFAARQVDQCEPERWQYNFNASTREEAIENNAQRLLDMWDFQWNHHLNDDDVKALVADDRLFEFTHTPVSKIANMEEHLRTRAYYLWEEAGRPEGNGKEFWQAAVEELDGYWTPYQNGYVPTADEVNDWSFGGFGHDSINCNVCIRARCEREGHPYLCEVCNGECGSWPNEEAKELYESWKPEEPPVGEGYQIWETVSEGSPISPVFSDPKILAEFMSNSKPWGGSKRMSAKDWLTWITDETGGWAPSAVIVNGEFKDGVAANVDFINSAGVGA